MHLKSMSLLLVHHLFPTKAGLCYVPSTRTQRFCTLFVSILYALLTGSWVHNGRKLRAAAEDQLDSGIPHRQG